ncbi:MAG: AAA family ATPase [Rubrivivax sp.]|nr:AAA family ATPase [Rubrivivax sp.]
MPDSRTTKLQLLASPCLFQGPQRHDLPDSVPGYLLVFLGARGDWVLREELAALLWPQADEASAQHNLRVNLNRLRPWLRRWQIEPALLAQPRRLRLNLPTDVQSLRVACARGDWLVAAALPYGGFAQGLSFRAFAALGEWAAAQRDLLFTQWRDAMLRAVPLLPGPAAPALLRRALDQDPCDQVLARALFDALLADGRRDEARAAFEHLQQVLQTQLGAQADAELQAHVRRRLDAQGDEPPPLAARPIGLPRSVVQPPRLVGREREVAALMAADAGVWLVAGEAGIGKTRLLEETLPTAAWLRCVESDGAALAPLLGWLDDQQQALPALEGPWACLQHLLPTAGQPAPAGDAAAGELPLQVLAAAVGLLQATASAVVVDDAQWLDATTAEMLMQLARSGRPRLYLSYRPGQLGADASGLLDALADRHPVHRVTLTPLDGAGVAQLLASMSQSKVDAAPQATAWLLDRSAGNPFYAIELLRERFDSRRLDSADRQWIDRLETQAPELRAAALPTRLTDLVQRRVRRLSQGAQRVLTIVVVAGEVHDVAALADAAELSPWITAQALVEARGAGLLEGRRCAHDLVREAVQQVLPPETLRWTHARVAQALHAHLAPQASAQHWWAAGQPRQALQAAWQAVQRARARGLQAHLLPQLARWQQQHAHDTSTRGSLRVAQALLLQELARPEAELEARAALAEWPDPPERAWALLVLARLAFQGGSLTQAHSHCSAAAEADPDNLDVLRLASQLALQQGQAAAAVPALQAEVRALRRAAASPALADAMTSLGALHDELGQVEQGLPLHQEAWALADHLQARRTQVDVAINLLWCCCALPQHLEHGLGIAETALALGEFDGSDTLRNNLAWAYADAGQPLRALPLYRQLAAGRDPSLRCVAWSRIAALLARTGAPADAQAEALEQTVLSMRETDFYVAQASAVIALLNHGNNEQAAAARRYIRPGQELDPWMQGKLDEAQRLRPSPPAT